ncbi:MAG TPA: polyprenyl synthetase family protein [Thermodesulfovibrionales bacterium]|jgi:octaprenyl-diphosphate synthase|nr:polyprenyl synthetase family protein [Thermodesulfovibrionales bacterium]
MDLQQVFGLYEPELKIVEDRLKDFFKSIASPIPLIGKHLIDSGGKRLRPLLLILSADISGFKGEARLDLAGIIESIHAASLLHDDVVDAAEVRRGKSSAHSIWGNQIVILVGDFLYANALRLAVLQKNQKIMETLSGATTRMTEGEILQLTKIGDPDITEEEYLNIISAKTGALISAACRIGAILGSLPEDKENALSHFGMKTGTAFQMADDILDYMADEGKLGKRLGKDLREGKITLPIIYLLKVATDKEVREVKNIIKDGFKQGDLKRIRELFKKHNVLTLSFKKAHGLISDAKVNLEMFPHSAAKEALLTLADYVLSRGK